MEREVLEINPRERLKAEKHPLDILSELSEIIKKGYEETPEENLVRLQWYGLYHDKPRVGYFLLRVKVPGGILSARQVEVLGDLAHRFNNYAELTLRQDIQLHYVRLEDLPEVFDRLKSVELFPVGACGDTVRNITTCPLCGVEKYELFDVVDNIRELEGFFHNPENREYFNLPRKFKITISACPYHCNMPEIHDLAFVGTTLEGAEGFAAWVGGGLSSTPRIARKLGIFVERDKVLEVAKAIVDIWKYDPENRRSFVKARFKYMVDRLGVERIKEMLLERLSFVPADLKQEPIPIKRYFHTGLGEQKQKGFYYLGIPIPAGRIKGSQLLKISELMERFNLSLRITQRQNLVLTDIPEDKLETVKEEIKELGFHLDVSEARAISVACTSDPFCNYSVGPSKETLLELLEYLEKELGKIEDIAIGVDGCPHACAHHWLNDIGLQATHLRHPDGSIETTYNLVLRGGYGKHARVGKIIVKKVPLEKLKGYLKNLILAFRNSEFEDFHSFVNSKSDEELISIMSAKAVEDRKLVKITIFGPLTRFSGGLAEIEVSAQTVHSALEFLEKEFEGFRGRLFDDQGHLKPFVKVFLNEEDISYLKGLDTELKEGDHIMLYPALAGGSPTFDELELHELAIEFEDKPPQELISWAIENFHPKLYIAFSGQAEDMVLLDMAWRISPEVRVFTVDTGRLHEETYRLIQEIEERYNIKVEIYFPSAQEVEELVKRHGINCFYKSVELRHLCCHIRKVRPLVRALSQVDAWFTGLRREQWASRQNIMKIEVDHDHGQIVKINPIADWSERQVWEYIKKNNLPYNKLYEMGYRSIGCEPCTKPVAPYEDPRAGRWWWEKDAPKECGMHCSIETGGFEKIADKLIKEDKDGHKSL